MATNGSFSQQEQYKNNTEQYPATSGPADANTGSASGNDLSKDEVGWYFVEQYYTTLSKSPEKLHLFYGKRSQFVSGLEAEVAPVSVGRSAIQERIKQLDFQDCKVRVSNVDSQASYDNIVIQVIGETSTPPAQSRAAPPTQAAKPAPAATPAATPATPSDKDKENVLPGAGWQSVGGENAKRQNRPQSISSPPEKEGTMGYVRNVTEKVQTEELRTALGSFGQLIYFDVNRQKNCAFVEYATPEGYQAAAAANPHQVSGEPIYVEPRRPKAGAYGGNGYAGGRGGLNQRGRGQFPNRGRGGGGTPRGRGSSQATNA